MPNPTLNRRYQKLIDQLDRLSPYTREMFLYLFAMVAAGQGIVTVVNVEERDDRREILMYDPLKKKDFKVTYPEGLEPEFADMAISEMERLLRDESMATSMDPALFRRLYAKTECRECRYARPECWQICNECYYAGRPINKEFA